MDNHDKSSKDLMEELADLRKRISEMEAANIELMQVKSELRNSEEKWRLLYENLPGGSFVINSQYLIQDVNDVLCETTGYKREELIGKLCDIVCPKGPHKCPIFDDGKKSIDNDVTSVKTKDGRLVPIIKSARRIPLQEEELVVENFQDISDTVRIKD
jgi:PAS domain S-box-containing protein